ncbi:hypothetical protein ACFC3F_06980 [Microbacterium sp. NPDC055910]|uniref:hypothetical protein n=1 Tax=Microbacterium sp. NPDC055910 TaxID=3345659 RepID=UPI0035DCEA61
MIRHHRPHAAALGAVLTAVFALGLVACAPDPAGPTPAPTDTRSLSPAPETPVPEPPQPPAANLPTSCDHVGSTQTRAETVDPLVLQGDGEGFIRPVPPDAALVLGCDWFGGDTTGYLVLISEADAAASASYIASLAADGWSCGPGAGGGDLCSVTTPNSQYPVDTVETVYTRGDVWIYQSATNLDGAALLADLQSSIWES